MNIDLFNKHYSMLVDFCNKSSNISTMDEDKARCSVDFHNFPTRKYSGFEIATLGVYGIMFWTGILGNILVCVVIVKQPSMHTAINLFLVSLAFTDIIIFSAAMPVEVYMDYFYGDIKWELGEAVCKLAFFLPEMATNASVLTIVALSVERYLAICHPFRSIALSSMRRATRLIVAIWLISIIFAVPGMLSTETVALIENQSYFKCSYESSDSFLTKFNGGVLSSVIFFLIPFSVLVVIYYRIAIVLHKRPKIGESRTLDPNTKSTIWMLAAVVFSFLLCWAPFHAQWIVYIYVSSEYDESESLRVIEKYLYCIGGFTFYLSSTINPILYNVVSTKYRDAFKATLCNQKMLVK